MARRALPGSLALVLTCEHASNRVPAAYAQALSGASHLLNTHRAFDPGALDFARYCAGQLSAPLIAGQATRLLIDLNRSADQPGLWSRWSTALTTSQQRDLLRKVYMPYREATQVALKRALGAHRSPPQAVLHLSVHSFTPLLRGQRRSMQVAFLFDPQRPLEVALARRWRSELLRLEPRLKLAFNRPYKGTADGHTTALRRVFPPKRYAGLELEINQALPRRGGPRWQRLQRHLAESLARALQTGF
jgi:predicted N-formylglutamate amidohydrolase